MHRDQILSKIKKIQPGYLPTWVPAKKEPGWAVSEVFANVLSDLHTALENVPNKLFISYLNKLGYTQNPPLAAKVPVTFVLTENYKGGIIIPKGTDVASKSKVNFETIEAMMATSTKLISLFDYEVSDDTTYITDHTEALLQNKAITLFSKDKDDNYIYFGDDSLFNIHKKEGTKVGLSFTIPNIPNGAWEYYGAKDKEDTPQWYPFKVHIDTLQKLNYYSTIKTKINGIESYWIRVKVKQNHITNDFKMNFSSYSNIDALFHNDSPLKLEGPFYPFGRTPQVNDSFYIASSEAFSKHGFPIKIDFQYDWNKPYSEPLSWEYWNGKAWKSLGGSSFTCPKDMTQTIVNGEKNYWVRVRLLKNNQYITYSCNNTSKILEPTFTPPVINHINISVKNKGEDVEAQHIYQYSNKIYTPPPFNEYAQEEHEEQSIYLGFDSPFELGLISLFIKLQNNESRDKRVLKWQYYSKEDHWTTFNVRDGSSAFSKSGLCQFIAANNPKKIEKFAVSCYWIRAIFDEVSDTQILLDAIYMNTIEARESKTMQEVLLGSSDGSGSQKFILHETPVFDLKLWVLETILPEGFEGYIDRFGEGYWVLWSPVEGLDTILSDQRVYTINSVLGEIVFGDDTNGKIPNMGRDNITVSYRIGGGSKGNVSAKHIDTLIDTVAYVDSVTNHLDASGGADMQSIDRLMQIAPKRIKHRYKTVSTENYYTLALEASSAVTKVSVIPDKGAVALVIVPLSQQFKPMPSVELKNVIESYMNDRAPATVNISVHNPKYIDISLDITITLSNWTFATTIMSSINEALEHFLDPLHGGLKQEGWEFGTLPLLADFYLLFFGIEGIAAVADLKVTLSDAQYYSLEKQEMPILDQYSLISNGSHSIKIDEESV